MKKKKLADTIKRITVPQFLQKKKKNRKALTENKRDAAKSSLKRLGNRQKKMDIAQLRCFPLCNILKPLESDLQEEDYKLNRNDNLKTTVFVDFMSMVLNL